MSFTPYEIETDDGVSPTSVLRLGLSILDASLQQFASSENATGFVAELFSIGIALVVFLYVALIAINLLMVLITAWISIFASIIFLGFGGSQWTREYAINYFKNALTIGVKVMCTLLLVSLADELMREFTKKIDQFQLKDYATLLVAVLVLFKLIDVLPDQLANMVAGFSMGTGSLGSAGYSQMKHDMKMAVFPLTAAFRGKKALQDATQRYENYVYKREQKKAKKTVNNKKDDFDKGKVNTDSENVSKDNKDDSNKDNTGAKNMSGGGGGALHSNSFGGYSNANTTYSYGTGSDASNNSLGSMHKPTLDEFNNTVAPFSTLKGSANPSSEANQEEAMQTKEGGATDRENASNGFQNSFEQRLNESEQKLSAEESKSNILEQEKAQIESERDTEKQRRETIEQNAALVRPNSDLDQPGKTVSRPLSVHDKMNELFDKFNSLRKKDND